MTKANHRVHREHGEKQLLVKSKTFSPQSTQRPQRKGLLGKNEKQDLFTAEARRAQRKRPRAKCQDKKKCLTTINQYTEKYSLFCGMVLS